MAVYDDIIFDIVREAEIHLENQLDANIIYFNSEIRINILTWFREIVEKLAQHSGKKDAVAIVLTTPGGQAEAVEKLVEIVRHHFRLMYVVVPFSAMSAGTILCMAADKIYMDYASSLGPIDPQVLDREGRFLVPALGHLDKVNELISKSGDNTITPVEFEWLMRQDFAILRFYEQARDLSRALLERWLVQYKFKDWSTHRTHNPGTPVTSEEKQARASEIARLLANNTHWHSHGRMIGMRTVRDQLRLEVDDFGGNPDLSKAVRRYSDTLSEHLARSKIPQFLYTRHAN
jgi:membrane-bound ClpP family serine protease